MPPVGIHFRLQQYPRMAQPRSTVLRCRCPLAARNAGLPEPERIVFRIGINLGDVALVDGDVYGDGVNVAARLEQLAEPGGVMVSGTACDHLQGKLDWPLDFAGDQQVKNISRPVRMYRLRLDGKAKTAAAAIVEVYKGKPVDARQVASALHVGFVLEGSIQRQRGRVRITAQLIDAKTGHHLWSDNWDRPAEDVFAVQTEIAEQVTNRLGGGVGLIQEAGRAAAKRKRPENLNASGPRRLKSSPKRMRRRPSRFSTAPSSWIRGWPGPG